MKNMPLKLKTYSGIIIFIGIFLLVFGVSGGYIKASIQNIFFFTVLAIITECFCVIIKSETGLSVIFAVGLAVVLIFDPFTASIITFLGIFCRVEFTKENGIRIFNTNIYKDLFNGSAYAICAVASGLVYHISASKVPIMYGNVNILGTILATIVYVSMNLIIYVLLVTILDQDRFGKVLLEHLWVIKNLLAIAPLGIILALAHLNFGKFVVALFFIPLLLARYSFKLYMDMRHVYFETIKALSSAMEAKDQYTNGHSYRVADYAVGIAEQMGLKTDTIDRIRTAAILHDIGKIGIADSILNKCGQLENNEYLEIQKHPEIGAKILSEVDFLAEVANIIKHHHERYDGKGYPDKLEGPQISIESCILAVADAYDAMTSDRPYRRAMNQQTAMNIVLEQVGKQFNPIVVKAFIDYLNAQPKEKMSHVS